MAQAPSNLPLPRWSIVALIVAASFFALAETVADPDLWGHVAFGQDILEKGQIIQPDPYSYLTKDYPWINHEWLAEVTYALLYDNLGPPGLVIFKTILSVSIIVGLVYLVGTPDDLPALIAVAITLVPLRMGLGTCRPQLFTYFFFTIVIMAIREREDGRGAKLLWLMPLFFATWINMHGGVLAGGGVLGAWAAARAVERKDYLALILATVAAAAILVNPYVLGLPLFLLRTATVPRPEISEWAPLKIVSFAGASYLALMFMVLWRGGARSWSARIALAACAIAPLISTRHLPLFAIAAAGLGVANPRPSKKDAGEEVEPTPAAAPPRWMSVATWIAPILMIALAVPRLMSIRLEPATLAYPSRTIEQIRESGYKGPLVIDFDWGEYAIWHLWPNVQVSLDGRRETVYSDEIYKEQTNFRDGVGEWDKILKRPGTELALVSKGMPVFALMSLLPDWTLVSQDDLSALFARKGSNALELLIRTKPNMALPTNGKGLYVPWPTKSDHRPIVRPNST